MGDAAGPCSPKFTSCSEYTLVAAQPKGEAERQLDKTRREGGPVGEGGSDVELAEMEWDLLHAPVNFRLGIWSQKKGHGKRERLCCVFCRKPEAISVLALGEHWGAEE